MALVEHNSRINVVFESFDEQINVAADLLGQVHTPHLINARLYKLAKLIVALNEKETNNG